MAITKAAMGMWSSAAVALTVGTSAVMTEGFSKIPDFMAKKKTVVEASINPGNKTDTEVAEDTATQLAALPDAKPDTEQKIAIDPPALDAPKIGGEAGADPKTNNAEKTPAVAKAPRFDIMRVEENGSLLVAGSAQPNSTVQLRLEDGSIIGTGKAGAEGDFVILPDKNLETGDYVISLHSILENKNEIVSGQTGIVQIPERGGEVLALISEDGKASRIIAKPSVSPEPKPEPQVASMTDENRPTETEVAKVELPKEPVEKPELAEVVEPKQDSVEVAEEVSKVDEVAKPTVDQSSEAEPQEVAKTVVPPTAKVQPNIPQVVVEAVEVEGRQIFVAGAIPKGELVRIYIDNTFVGSARGTVDNRFLLSRQFDLKPGQHAVRADVVDRKTGDVLSRAEVALLHEAPIAADPVINTAEVTKPKETEAVSKAADTKQVPVPDTDLPKQADQPVEVASVAPQTSDVSPTASQKVEPKASSPKTSEISKPEKPAAQEAQPEVTKKKRVLVLPDVESPKKSKVAAKKPQAVETAAVEDAVKVEPEAEVAKPVLKTGRAIIIKPGDNLWRISRRTYGRGIRYTTIYNANRDQIRDPSRIYIGQIFKIPEIPESSENEAENRG